MPAMWLLIWALTSQLASSTRIGVAGSSPFRARLRCSTPTEGHVPAQKSRSAANRIQTPRKLCSHCSRPLQQCICPALPDKPISVTTKVLVLQHPAEAKRRIATVPLIPLCLQHVEVLRGICFDSMLEPLSRALEDGYRPIVLFPHDGAIAIDRPGAIDRWHSDSTAQCSSDGMPKKILMVLLDGTWTQARHMMRHSPRLVEACTPVCFEQPYASAFNALRREPEANCMSTVEACARALRLVEPTTKGLAAAAHMETSLLRMVERQLACVATNSPRRMDRKSRTLNRKHHDALQHCEGVAQPEISFDAHSPSPSMASTPRAPDNLQAEFHLPWQSTNSLSALFETVFTRAERSTLVSALGDALDEDAVRSRLAQARFLLAGCERTQERELIRSSLTQQGQYYFQQRFSVLYEDAHIVIVDKPFDTQIALRSHQKARYAGEVTLCDWATRQLREHTESQSLRPCHQLDFATSGLHVLAKTDEALSILSQAFDKSASDVNVDKEYTAVVFGWPEWDEYDFHGVQDILASSSFKMQVVEEEGISYGTPGCAEKRYEDNARQVRHARRAVVDTAVADRWGPSRMPPAASWNGTRLSRPRRTHTQIQVIRRGHCLLPGPHSGHRVSLVRLLPSTGRRHQLRVTLAYLGHPILGGEVLGQKPCKCA